MGTRAVFIFKDERDSFSIYKHWDGYPEGAANFLVNALPFAWELPRYEACDFAAAFVAGNKQQGGGDVYLTTSPEYHGDLEYVYTITQANNGQLVISVYSVYPEEKRIFYGRLKDFIRMEGNTQAKVVWNKIMPSKNPL